MIHVIYFNQWFSSIGQIIKDTKKLAKQDGINIKFIASSKRKDHVYKKYVDKFFYEDYDNIEKDPEVYLNWVLDLCKREGVDLFYCKKYSELIANNLDKFKDLGVKVIHSYNANVTNKIKMYELIKDGNIINGIIPQYKILDENIYEYLVSKLNANIPMCIKAVDGEGGSSYREIVSSKKSVSDLYNVSTSLTINDISQIIKNLKPEEFTHFMCMEKLEQPEVSIDCLMVDGEFLSVARKKEENRIQQVYFDPLLNKRCLDLYSILKLDGICNIQFRRNDSGYDKLLDINPRISGGAYIECKAGINLVYIQIIKELSKLKNINSNYVDNVIERYKRIMESDDTESMKSFNFGKISHIEKAVALD